MDEGDKLDDKRIQQAIFRYGLIAEALAVPKGELAEKLREVADAEHQTPDGEPLAITVRTLERWITAYKRGGVAGLMRRPRKDRGRTRAITEAALARAIALRKEGPDRSTSTIIDILARSGEVAAGALRRSTLDRHLDKKSASRRMMHTLGAKRYVRLRFERPLDFVVGDFHAGPWVRTETGEIRRAELGAFIDHCSRYVPESRYFMTENLMGVRRGLRALCIAWGIPRRLYVDNGPGYQAHRFHFGCAEIGIDLCHSRPYQSEGRGVIERFNRTVKDAFETEVRLRKEPPTLEELNALWRAWLDERYHRVTHSETGEAPLDRWNRLYPEADVRHVDPVLLDEVLRLHGRRTVHVKTSTVEVGGVRFVVDTSLRRRKVDVLFDPNDLSSVLVYFDRRRIQRAEPQRPGEAPLELPPKAAPPAQSVDYLELLRRDHDQRRQQDLSTLRFRTPAKDADRLSLPLLLDRLRVCSGRALGEVEIAHARATLEALAPLETSIADAALKTAVASLGPRLHVSQYCRALTEHVLAARKKGHP
jgi:transposase InsO family protein